MNIFAMEDAYLKTGEAVAGVKWLNDRMFNYVGGVRRQESLDLLRKYCSERDYNIITVGVRE